MDQKKFVEDFIVNTVQMDAYLKLMVYMLVEDAPDASQDLINLVENASMSVGDLCEEMDKLHKEYKNESSSNISDSCGED